MPVSKKRKKDGHPVKRAQPAEGEAVVHESHPEARAAAPEQRGGKPKNPFVAHLQAKRGAQRGR